MNKQLKNELQALREGRGRGKKKKRKREEKPL